MERYCIVCRDYHGDVKCSVALSADTKEERLKAFVNHGLRSMDMKTHLNLENLL
ncbi:MAG TPA: hypothetical protein VLM43_16915 [Desulfobacterales bacterium]|nr:hypothetical protein [Desulfobacterales bacterium]